MGSVKCFVHVATINNYQHIVNEFIDRMQAVSFPKESACFFVCGNNPVDTRGFPQVHTHSSIEPGEFLTLNRIIDHSKSNDGHILYLHTKGVTTPDNECINDWRKYMSYFLINKFAKCVEILNSGFDTCGVDLRPDPVTHYSGNFWWSTAAHVRSLPSFAEMPTILTERHKAEFWIGQKGNHKSLWDCGISQFQRHMHRYPESNYVRDTV